MSKIIKISRRWFLTAGAAVLSNVAKSSDAQTFDFLGQSNNFEFIEGGQSNNYNSRQEQTESCGSNSAAMRQRTSNSRPIYQQHYAGNAAIGSIAVSINQATLYHITAQGVALAYPIGAGDDSRSLIGQTLVIGRKASWPTWTPTANIARRMGISQATRPGGPCNPLGAFALYLYENGRDTIYRIHGTNDPSSIGKPNVSSGCIRMYNEDVLRLQKYISKGTKVSVYSGPVPGANMNPSRNRLVIQ